MALPPRDGAPGPPMNICRKVDVSVFASSSAYSRVTRTTSPNDLPDQWQAPQTSWAGRMSATPGIGRG
jgi:hypothetical protein